MNDLQRAKKIIEVDGEDGYRSAARIIGPDKTDKLLANLVARNMGTNPENEEVLKFVAEVRARKGFSPGSNAPKDKSATIRDVHGVLQAGKDRIMLFNSVVGDQIGCTAEWCETFNQKANHLVRAIALELGDKWTSLPLETVLGQKASETLRDLRALFPNP